MSLLPWLVGVARVLPQDGVGLLLIDGVGIPGEGLALGHGGNPPAGHQDHQRHHQGDAEQQLLPPQQQQRQECAANEDGPVIGQPGAGKIQQPKAPQAAQAELPQPLAAQAPQQQGRHQQRQT